MADGTTPMNSLANESDREAYTTPKFYENAIDNQIKFVSFTNGNSKKNA